MKIYIQILFVFRSKNQHGYACRGCVIFEMRACENRSYFFVKKKMFDLFLCVSSQEPVDAKAHPNQYQSTPQPLPKHTPTTTKAQPNHYQPLRVGMPTLKGWDANP